LASEHEYAAPHLPGLDELIEVRAKLQCSAAT
jgi:hypothetical protein